MNKNSTQKETRNFVSKISDFLKMLSLLPANLPGAYNFMCIGYKNPFQHQPVFQSTYFSFLNCINSRQPLLSFKPVKINQFQF